MVVVVNAASPVTLDLCVCGTKQGVVAAVDLLRVHGHGEVIIVAKPGATWTGLATEKN